MGFLAPGLLALALAAAVPLVLHLFQRHQGPRVVFPALRYLRRAEKEHARRIKLRQILLLALRVAALVVLALAAARPLLRRGGATHPPTAVVIVLDNSLSTGTVVGSRRVLDLLKARALESLARAGAGDRFWLVRAGAPWEPAVPGGADAVAEQVRRTELSAQGGDLGAALRRARTILETGAEGRAAEIQLLTDLQRTALPSRPLDAGGPRVVAWAPEADAPANRGVVAVEVGGGLAPRAGERSTVAATVAGAGDSVTVRLVVDGRAVGAAIAPVGATAVMPLPARPTGIVSGAVEIDPDALRGDDRRYFAARVQPPPTVALAQPVAFVEDALEVLAGAGRIRRADAATADVVVAPAAEGAGAARAGRAAVVLAPAAPLELPATNRRLAAAGIPWRYEPARVAGEGRVEVPEDAGELGRALQGARIRESYRLAPAGAAVGDSVLLRLADGSPWLVRGALEDGGRYLLLASPLTPEASTVPTSAAMLPLLDRMIGTWSADDVGRVEARPGAWVEVPAGVDAVERPDGTREAVEAGGLFRLPAEPGVYRFLSGGRAVDAVAVNPPAEETELERADLDRLEALLPGWEVDLTDEPEGWRRAVFGQRHGREAWWPLAMLALALLLAEAFVAAAGRGRAAPAARSEAAPKRPIGV